MKVSKFYNGRGYLPTYIAISCDGRVLGDGRTTPAAARRDGEFQIALGCQRSDEYRIRMILDRGCGDENHQSDSAHCNSRSIGR